MLSFYNQYVSSKSEGMHLVSVDLNTSLLRSVLLVWLTLNLGLGLLGAQKPKLNIVFVMPANARISIANSTAPAIVIALKTIESRGTLSEYDVDWQLVDSQCSTSFTAKRFYEEWRKFGKKVHAIMGGHCEKICELLATIAESLNVPFISIGCKDTHDRNHLRFPTYLTMEGWRPSIFPILRGMFQTYGWTRLAILATTDPASIEVGLRVREAIEARNWTAVFIQTTIDRLSDAFQDTEADREIESMLDEIKRQARVVFFAMEKVYAARILVLAQRQGMYNGEFVFIGFALPYIPAASIGATEEEWRSAKVGLLYFRLLNHYVDLEGGRFLDLINSDAPRKHPKLQMLVQRKLDTKIRYYIKYAGDLYCALRVYSYMVNSTVSNMMKTGVTNVTAAAEKAAANGTLILSKIFEISSSATLNAKSVEDTLDMLLFDSAGRRASSWILMNREEFDKEKPVFGYLPVGDLCEILPFPKMSLIWPGKATEAPRDVPNCGWDEEKCLKQTDLILICVCSLLGVLSFTGALVFIYNTRRMKQELERKTLAEWRVKWSEVVVIGDNVIGRLSTHEAHRSRTSFEVGSQIDHSDIRSSHRSTAGQLSHS